MTNKFDRIHTNTNKKYIIRNCPAIYGIDDGFLCSYREDEEDEKYCYDCTDCIMKQIVELCKHYKKHSDCGRDCPSFGRFLNKLLDKLDIQEVE